MCACVTEAREGPGCPEKNTGKVLEKSGPDFLLHKRKKNRLASMHG